MYPFLIRGASTSFLVAMAVLGGCSGSSGPPPQTLPMDSAALTDSPHCEGTPSGSSKIKLYKCDSEVGTVFFTTLKDCSIPEKFTFQATTRQLLVGVMDLKVDQQDPVQFGSTKALRSVVYGTMDADPFLMSIFTFHEKDKNCVTDLALWKGRSAKKPSKDETLHFGKATEILASRLMTTLVFPKEELGADGR